MSSSKYTKLTSIPQFFLSQDVAELHQADRVLKFYEVVVQGQRHSHLRFVEVAEAAH